MGCLTDSGSLHPQWCFSQIWTPRAWLFVAACGVPIRSVSSATMQLKRKLSQCGWWFPDNSYCYQSYAPYCVWNQHLASHLLLAAFLGVFGRIPHNIKLYRRSYSFQLPKPCHRHSLCGHWAPLVTRNLISKLQSMSYSETRRSFVLDFNGTRRTCRVCKHNIVYTQSIHTLARLIFFVEFNHRSHKASNEILTHNLDNLMLL